MKYAVAIALLSALPLSAAEPTPASREARARAAFAFAKSKQNLPAPAVPTAPMPREVLAKAERFTDADGCVFERGADGFYRRVSCPAPAPALPR
jgi:hypothetical protein